MRDQIRCYSCGKFLRIPYDSRTIFGCSDQEAPEPYEPDFFCKKCSNKFYKELLKGYECCDRYGDWQKSKSELRAAKEAGLEWVSSPLVSTLDGRNIHNEYIAPYMKRHVMPYGEYLDKRRKENRCICWRLKNKDGNCERCNHHELHCLCKYDNGMPF